MEQTPSTRLSLLARVQNREDQQAWHQFAAVYRPAIVRLARRKGLQAADAEDLAQRVMVSVAGAMKRFKAGAGRPRFRTWLYRVTENAIWNSLRDAARDRAHRGEFDRDRLASIAARSTEDADWLRWELRREVFHWAARQIRAEYQPDTWNAFWLTAVESGDIEQVARQLGKSPGAIHAARSRVIRRLAEKVREFEDRDD